MDPPGEKLSAKVPFTWLRPINSAGCFSPAHLSEEPRRQIACGALLCPPRQVSVVLDLLTKIAIPSAPESSAENGEDIGELTKGRVQKYIGPEKTQGLSLCVHVTPNAAIALDTWMQEGQKASKSIPEKLTDLIRTGTIKWRPGMRLRSKNAQGKGADKHQKFLEEQAAKGLKRRRDILNDRPENKKSLFKFAELFAGIGGFRIGLEKIGGECVFSSEVEHYARCTYAYNFGCVPDGDILAYDEADVPHFNLLTAGFPCQSHSKAGFKKGFNDFRGSLFFEVTRMLHYHYPEAFLLENVPNLLETNDGEAIKLVMDELKNAGGGYDVQYKVINSCHWVPQKRERLYFVGFRCDKNAMAQFSWPKTVTDEHANIKVRVRDILEPREAVDLKEHQLSNRKWNKTLSTAKARKQQTIRVADLDGCARTLCSRYLRGYTRYSEFVPYIEEDGSVVNHQELYNNMVSQVDLENDESHADEEDEKEEFTVDDNRERGKNPRYFTPRECARLQGFPDTFALQDVSKSERRIYHQLGNAVVPLVIEAIGQEIANTSIWNDI
eukprot:m.228618 g.228618  ORF g.228618 m.228618 type:complete len:553 (-) comp15981_c0_seq14:878-2536(-)